VAVGWQPPTAGRALLEFGLLELSVLLDEEGSMAEEAAGALDAKDTSGVEEDATETEDVAAAEDVAGPLEDEELDADAEVVVVVVHAERCANAAAVSGRTHACFISNDPKFGSRPPGSSTRYRCCHQTRDLINCIHLCGAGACPTPQVILFVCHHA